VVRGALAAVAALAIALPAGSALAADPGNAPRPDADAWMLVDADDGEKLAGSGVSRELAIASATKLMTAYLALQELPLGRMLPAAAYDALPVESVLGTRAGERVSVRDLLYALILASANDAAVTLAEGVSGSVPKFVDDMNAQAEALELTDTGFTNPIGLDAPGNHSSARDLATLADELMERKLFRRIVDATEHVVKTDQRSIPIETRNTLLFRAPWVTGIKTGHTLQAGYVLVGSARRTGVDLVSVVLGAPSEAARDASSLELLEYGFSLYRERTPVRAGAPLATPGLTDQDEELELVAKRAVRVSARRDQEVVTEISAPDEVEGPIDRGERLGEAIVKVDGRAAGSSPLVAARSAEAASVADKLGSRIPIIAAIGAVVILIGVLLVRRRRGAGPRTPEERMRHHEDRMRRREEGQGRP
jgi:serine-type D-Ala-D-Ala carboxypeptidase (penicillin-binding protein 5/6)